jgi:hypothetical protein
VTIPASLLLPMMQKQETYKCWHSLEITEYPFAPEQIFPTSFSKFTKPSLFLNLKLKSHKTKSNKYHLIYIIPDEWLSQFHAKKNHNNNKYYHNFICVFYFSSPLPTNNFNLNPK